jgi:hypothetical protein
MRRTTLVVDSLSIGWRFVGRIGCIYLYSLIQCENNYAEFPEVVCNPAFNLIV